MSILTFTPLASSSKGNAYLVSAGGTNILLEAGLTVKELRRRCPVPLAELDACFVTHEHNDHSKCVGQLIRMGIPVYMSEGTARALEQEEAMVIEPLEHGYEVIKIGSLRVMAFDTYHNTEQPIGFLVGADGGEKLLFAVDTANLAVIVPGLTQIAIECNHADDLLERLDRLPDKILERIKRSHMEIKRTVYYLHQLDLSRVRVIYLLHMSATAGNACRFQKTFERHFPDKKIIVCEE